MVNFETLNKEVTAVQTSFTNFATSVKGINFNNTRNGMMAAAKRDAAAIEGTDGTVSSEAMDVIDKCINNTKGYVTDIGPFLKTTGESLALAVDMSKAVHSFLSCAMVDAPTAIGSVIKHGEDAIANLKRTIDAGKLVRECRHVCVFCRGYVFPVHVYVTGVQCRRIYRTAVSTCFILCRAELVNP